MLDIQQSHRHKQNDVPAQVCVCCWIKTSSAITCTFMVKLKHTRVSTGTNRWCKPFSFMQCLLQSSLKTLECIIMQMSQHGSVSRVHKLENSKDTSNQLKIKHIIEMKTNNKTNFSLRQSFKNINCVFYIRIWRRTNGMKPNQIWKFWTARILKN